MGKRRSQMGAPVQLYDVGEHHVPRPVRQEAQLDWEERLEEQPSEETSKTSQDVEEVHQEGKTPLIES